MGESWECLKALKVQELSLDALHALQLAMEAWRIWQ
jgi:hypothetical protein